MKHPMAICADSHKVRERRQYLRAQCCKSRTMVGFRESTAEPTVDRFEAEPTNLAFVAVAHLREHCQLARSFSAEVASEMLSVFEGVGLISSGTLDETQHG